MLRFALVKTLFPGLVTLLGTALLLSAWTQAVKLPWPKQGLLYIINLSFWIPATVILLIWHLRHPFSGYAKRRFALVLLLFVISVLPLHTNKFQNLSAQTLSVAGTFMLIIGLSRWRLIHHWLAKLARVAARQREIPPQLFISIFFLLFLGITLLISWHCFSFLPTYTDSMAQYVHAKFVASGHLFGIPRLALPEFFPVWLMVHEDKWYSQYPPMHQTLLGIMYYLGMPWLHSPLEGALTLVLVYAIARRAYGEATARLAALLTILCQFVLFMSAEFMNHTTTLFFGTLMIFCYQRLLDALRSENRRTILLWSLAAGLSAGAAFLTRPLTAVALTAPLALHALYHLVKNRRSWWKPCLVMLAAGLFCVALQLYYNKQTTGQWLMHAYTRYHVNSVGKAMGFYKEGTVIKTLRKVHGDWTLLNVMFYEWSLPSSLFMMLACLLPLGNTMTRLLVGVVASQTLSNTINQFHSTVFGPRYMFEASSAIIILTALGIMRLPVLLRTSGLQVPAGATLRGIIIVMMLAVFASGIIYRVPNNIRIYSRYMDSHVPFYYDMLRQSQHPALIFLGRGNKNDPVTKFRWMAWTNPPDEAAPVIFAYDRGDEKNRKLMNYYSNRHAYVEIKGKLEPVPKPADKKP